MDLDLELATNYSSEVSWRTSLRNFCLGRDYWLECRDTARGKLIDISDLESLGYYGLRGGGSSGYFAGAYGLEDAFDPVLKR